MYRMCRVVLACVLPGSGKIGGTTHGTGEHGRCSVVTAPGLGCDSVSHCIVKGASGAFRRVHRNVMPERAARLAAGVPMVLRVCRAGMRPGRRAWFTAGSTGPQTLPLRTLHLLLTEIGITQEWTPHFASTARTSALFWVLHARQSHRASSATSTRAGRPLVFPAHAAPRRAATS